jgi:hypothetical protein
MKKTAIILGINMLLSMANAFAQWEFTWKLENGTLTISGYGEMPDYDEPPQGENLAPWYPYADSITKLVIRQPYNIGKFAFCKLTALSSIHFGYPDAPIASIGEGAFKDCYNISSIRLPKYVGSIEDEAFSGCTNLNDVIFPVSDAWNLDYGSRIFAKCEKLTSITNARLVPQIIASNVFIDFNQKACTLFVQYSCAQLYKDAPVWKEFYVVGVHGLDIETYEDETGCGQLFIYPNPSPGACNVVIPEEFQHESSLTLSIYDNSGKLVQQIVIDNENPEYSLELTLKAKGVYVAVLSNGKRSVRGRIVFN